MPMPKPTPCLRLLIAEWLSLWVLLLALGGYIGYSEYVDYRQIYSSESDRLASQALVIEKNLAAQLVSANQALQGLLIELARRHSKNAGVGPLNDHLKLISDTLTGISTVLVTNANGKIIHANVASLVGFDSSVRDYFQHALKQRRQDMLFVSAPFTSALGKTSISLVREITGPHGEFGGVVLAALDPEFFGVLLDSVRFTPDTNTSLVHGDGKLFMIAPANGMRVGRDLAVPGSFFSQHKTSGQAASLFNGVTYLTRDARMIAFQTVQPPALAMDKALVVTVSRDALAIHANWLGQATKMAWLYAGLSLLLCSTLFFFQQRRRAFQRLAHAKESALRASDARLRSFFEATPDALLISDAQGIITMANQQVEELLDYSMDELVGMSIEALVPIRSRGSHPKLRDGFATTPSARRMSAGMAVKALRKDGSECDVEISLSRIETDEGQFFASALRDITERIKAYEKIKDLAYYDQLTGLPNRTLLLDRLKLSLTISSRSGMCGALLFIDLDHFKTLNDTRGHDIGDMQLKQVATRLCACVREGDTVARIGGDEFVVILAGLNKSEVEAVTDTEAVAVKILATLSQPYQLGEVLHSSSASMGATLFQGRRANIEDLMKQADLALYRAKDAGRNRMRFFDPSMETVVVKRVALEKDLRNAVAGQQFVLHYQAQVQGMGRVTGAEVLLRWPHPERGLVPPDEFITLAEETGVILPLGHWVLETACCQLEKWARVPVMAHLTLAVNVSALQFAQADFVAQVRAVVQRTGANPMRLKLELTESLLVGNVTDIIEKMVSLKSQGVGFSLDDFGTGYSSLAYLSRLPLDQLKIDKSFVNDVLTNPDDAAIARTIIALAHSLRLDVIAEGVETDAQREFLAGAGCHAYQGYFFGRPLPVAGFEALMRSP